MTRLKYFLLIGLLISALSAKMVVAQDEPIPEPENSSATFIPTVNSPPPIPPTIIDDTDSSSGVNDPDDGEN